MSAAPLWRAFAFWKLAVDPHELETLASWGEAGEAPAPGIRVLRADGAERCYRVVDGASDFLLYAAVVPMAEPPESAQVLAEIRDLSGAPCSYVLWYPDTRCVVIPFDPDAAVEAFWYERYMPPSKKTVLPQPVLSAYYAVRPLIPVALKLRLRKLVARKVTADDHLLDWPGDRSLDLLLELLLRTILMALGRREVPFLWFWPNAAPWAVVLTHDVETADGLARVEHVMGIEDGLGLRSSFNFVPKDYDVEDGLLGRMRESGFEIGVHGYTHDGLMFSKRSTYLERVAAVNEVGRRWGASGFRSPATYRNLEWFDRLELEYDSSVTDTAPFEPQPGGCASLFPYMAGDVVEVPMTLPQDHTLFGLLGQGDARVWLEKLAAIREAHGMACVLTHPDPAGGYIGLPENEARYREVLDVVAGSDAWRPLPRDLARWWRAREAADPTGSGAPAGASLASAELDSDGGLRLVAPVR